MNDEDDGVSSKIYKTIYFKNVNLDMLTFENEFFLYSRRTQKRSILFKVLQCVSKYK